MPAIFPFTSSIMRRHRVTFKPGHVVFYVIFPGKSENQVWKRAVNTLVLTDVGTR